MLQDRREDEHDRKLEVILDVEIEEEDLLRLEVRRSCLHGTQEESCSRIVVGTFNQSMLEVVKSVHGAEITKWVGGVGHVHSE